jgi:hypothetical protein
MSDYIFVNAAEPAFGIQVGVKRLTVHAPEKCAGQRCCIHNPSNHHMVTWPQNWRGDRGLMERTCPHGVGHPDPDDIAYKSTLDAKNAYYEAIHGCDGCCAT